MTTPSPKETYTELLSDYQHKLQKATRRTARISALRVAIFLAGMVAIYVAAGISATAVIIVSVAFVVAFILIVLQHQRVHQQAEELQRLVTINGNELKALQGDYSGFGDGKQFIEPGHPYAGDLDIFGAGSIFQYINRTATSVGNARLAQWLSVPCLSTTEIKERQQAVADLKSRRAWRQQFQSEGIRVSEETNDTRGLLSWLHMPAEFGSKLYRVLIVLTPIAGATMVALLVAGVVSFQLFVLYMFLPLGYAFAKAKKVQQSHELLSRRGEVLQKYGRLLAMIVAEDFDSTPLKNLQSDLTAQHHSALALRKLGRITQAFDSRLNIFAWLLLNYFVLWDILQARRLERWRLQYCEHVEKWLDIVAQIDALSSLGNYWHNRPDFIMPLPAEKSFVLKAQDCGHPLIHSESRVDNPVSFDSWRQFYIVTGANMAGKSTYLRTVGINFILAMAGAPVCASEFAFSPAEIYTSLRTTDDLLKSESYFFAELKRLKAIIDRLEAGTKLFIILDEILKGTNSADKQQGSKALLRKLLHYEASGLIATHDLSLGELAKEHPANITNKRFEVEIVNDNLLFDYKLKEGISQNLNATFLMRKMGITE
jgi:TM2 domain-containing membrane protein YozV